MTSTFQLKMRQGREEEGGRGLRDEENLKCPRVWECELMMREPVESVGRVLCPFEINDHEFKFCMTVWLCDISSNFQCLDAK